MHPLQRVEALRHEIKWYIEHLEGCGEQTLVVKDTLYHQLQALTGILDRELEDAWARVESQTIEERQERNKKYTREGGGSKSKPKLTVVKRGDNARD